MKPPPGAADPAGAIGTYLTYLPSLRTYADRFEQTVALHPYFRRVVVAFDDPAERPAAPPPANVTLHALGDAGEGHHGGALATRRRLFRLLRTHADGEPADPFVVDDWFFFLALFYPWMRLRRRRTARPQLLLYSPVTSHLLWFLDNSWRTLWMCRDFSLWRGRKLPFELWSYLFCDALSVQSEGLRNRYTRWRPRRPVFATPNAQRLPPEPPAPGPGPRPGPGPGPGATPGRKLRLGYAGNLSYNKGLDLILALDRDDLLARYDVVVAGRGHRAEGRRIEKLLAGSRFRLLGWLDAEALRDFYRDADILVLPTRHEGMPRVVTEFLALGKPAVVSDLPGLSDIESPLLFRFPKGDATAFLRAIDAAAAAVPPSAALLAGNRRALQALSPATTARRKADAIHRLLAERIERA